MAWILLLLAVACFMVPYFTTSFALGALGLILALVLLVTAMMLLLSARIGEATRNVDRLSAEELRTLREQAEAERQRKGGMSAAELPPNGPINPSFSAHDGMNASDKAGVSPPSSGA
jgi:uncharacterized protein (DUF58 family)